MHVLFEHPIGRLSEKGSSLPYENEHSDLTQNLFLLKDFSQNGFSNTRKGLQVLPAASVYTGYFSYGKYGMQPNTVVVLNVTFWNDQSSRFVVQQGTFCRHSSFAAVCNLKQCKRQGQRAGKVSSGILGCTSEAYTSESFISFKGQQVTHLQNIHMKAMLPTGLLQFSQNLREIKRLSERYHGDVFFDKDFTLRIS